MVSGRVQVKERASEDERCPYCRDALEGDLATSACEGCGLGAHVECWTALRRCPALGCGHEAPDAPPGALPRPEAPPPFTVGGTTTVIPPRPDAAPTPPPPPPPRLRARRRAPRGARQPAPRPTAPPTTQGEPWTWLAALLGVPALFVAWGLHGAWTRFHEVDPLVTFVCFVLGVPVFLLLAVPALGLLWQGLHRSPR